jgi:hypothetical protein
MKLEVGKLYSCVVKPFGLPHEECIFKVLDLDYEHHKGYTEYLIKAVIPSNFTGLGYETTGDRIWVKSSHVPNCKELPKTHPAWLLYGNK